MAQMYTLFQSYMCFISVLYLLCLVRNRLNNFLMTSLSYCPHAMSFFSLDYVHILYSKSTCIGVCKYGHSYLKKYMSTEAFTKPVKKVLVVLNLFF